MTVPSTSRKHATRKPLPNSNRADYSASLRAKPGKKAIVQKNYTPADYNGLLHAAGALGTALEAHNTTDGVLKNFYTQNAEREGEFYRFLQLSRKGESPVRDRASALLTNPEVQKDAQTFIPKLNAVKEALDKRGYFEVLGQNEHGAIFTDCSSDGSCSIVENISKRLAVSAALPYDSASPAAIADAYIEERAINAWNKTRTVKYATIQKNEQSILDFYLGNGTPGMTWTSTIYDAQVSSSMPYEAFVQTVTKDSEQYNAFKNEAKEILKTVAYDSQVLERVKTRMQGALSRSEVTYKTSLFGNKTYSCANSDPDNTSLAELMAEKASSGDEVKDWRAATEVCEIDAVTRQAKLNEIIDEAANEVLPQQPSSVPIPNVLEEIADEAARQSLSTQ